MYKIGEVANMLNVEKVVIFEKLISRSKDIEPYVIKEKGITYFTDFGIEVMGALISGLAIPSEPEIGQDEVEVEDDISSENVRDEEYVSDEDIQSINDERARLKREIMNCRNKLIELDGQHKQMDEALKHYQMLIKEDLDWIRIAEGKVAFRLKQ